MTEKETGAQEIVCAITKELQELDCNSVIAVEEDNEVYFGLVGGDEMAHTGIIGLFIRLPLAYKLSVLKVLADILEEQEMRQKEESNIEEAAKYGHNN